MFAAHGYTHNAIYAGRPLGLKFGPDPSTHARATIAGSIGNNACGAHAMSAGRSGDQVVDLDVVTVGGDRFTAGPGDAGPLTGPLQDLIGRLLCSDTLVHTWDLARATGQAEQLDAPAVTYAFTMLAPADEQLRGPGSFGPKIEPPAGADEQTRFLCFLGRRV